MEEKNKYDMTVMTNDEGEKRMESKMKEILADIEAYREAIENAEGALVEAEHELQEEIERRSAECCDDGFNDFPEYDKE